jgi:hypothetical protein
VDVDEAGREREAARIDFDRRAGALDFADRGYPIAEHREVANRGRRASAVKECRAADDYVPLMAGHIKAVSKPDQSCQNHGNACAGYARANRAGESAASVTPCSARSEGTPRRSARLAQSRPIDGEVSIP